MTKRFLGFCLSFLSLSFGSYILLEWSYDPEEANAYLKKLKEERAKRKTEEEILIAFEDIKRAGVDVLTLGQYMRPTINHLPVEKWYRPDEFDYFKKIAIEIGFLELGLGLLENI
mgnify:CR=1 FL=1